MVLQIIALGLVLGAQHAIEPDHIAAISTQTDGSLKNSMLQGVAWGLGHASMLTIVGLTILFGGLMIPEFITQSLEILVGVMLIGLGWYNLFKKQKKKHKKKKSFFIGMIHGLAGSSALVLLILTSTTNIFSGALFMLLFGIGSILGMTIVTGIVTLPLKNIKPKIIQTFAGILSMGVGTIVILSNVSIF